MTHHEIRPAVFSISSKNLRKFLVVPSLLAFWGGGTKKENGILEKLSCVGCVLLLFFFFFLVGVHNIHLGFESVRGFGGEGGGGNTALALGENKRGGGRGGVSSKMLCAEV